MKTMTDHFRPMESWMITTLAMKSMLSEQGSDRFTLIGNWNRAIAVV